MTDLILSLLQIIERINKFERMKILSWQFFKVRLTSCWQYDGSLYKLDFEWKWKNEFDFSANDKIIDFRLSLTVKLQIGGYLTTKYLWIPSRIRMVILQDFARIWQNLARRYIVLQEFLPESCKILQDNHFLQESCKIAIRLPESCKIAIRFARILQDSRSQKKLPYT